MSRFDSPRTNRIRRMELKTHTDPDYQHARRAASARRSVSKDRPFGSVSLVAVLRDARKRAPQDEVDRWVEWNETKITETP